jgi:hypothetical protein
MSEGGYSDRVAFGIKRSDDCAFVVFRRGRGGVLSGRKMIAGREYEREKKKLSVDDTHISMNESKMVTTGCGKIEEGMREVMAVGTVNQRPITPPRRIPVKKMAARKR